MKYCQTLAGLLLASVALFGQLNPPMHPCPAGVSIPNVRGRPGYTPPRQLEGAPPPLPSAENTLERLAYFVIPPDGRPCGIYVIGEASAPVVQSIGAALHAWKFTAATLEGQSVATRASVSLNSRVARTAPKNPPDFDRAVQLVNSKDPNEVASGLAQMESLSAKELPAADAFLGMALTRGLWLNADVPRGLSLLKRSAAKSDRMALFELGVLHQQGSAVPKNLKAAAEYFEQSAARGFVLAQERLAAAYADGLGVAQNSGRAIALYRLCAASSLNSCAVTLAQLLERENKNLDEALAWALVAQLRHAAAAGPLVQSLESKVSPASKLLAEAFADSIANTRPPR